MEAAEDAKASINPDIELPPVVSRLPSLEIDPTGNPYYKFPPFLSPPDGVDLIPFVDFKATGIEIALGSDVEEIDARGLATVELGIKHTTGDKRKKKKRGKKETVQKHRKISKWWEDWEEGEDLRRGDALDPNYPRTERFTAGAEDFQRGRSFLPKIQSLYDHFRHYVGLLSHPSKKYRFGKRSGKSENNAEDDFDEDDEAELENEAAHIETDQADPVPVSFVEQGPRPALDSDLLAEIEHKEMRMDAFLNDPERSIKIFFSSFYKDKGLWYSVPRLRDGPKLILFFLDFFIRNRLMPDYNREFMKAKKVVELAIVELPQSTRIGMGFPDTLGKACVELWKTRTPSAWYSTDPESEPKLQVEPEPEPQPVPILEPEPKPDAVSDSVSKPNFQQDKSEQDKEWEEALRANGAEEVPPDGWGTTGLGWGDVDGGGEWDWSAGPNPFDAAQKDDGNAWLELEHASLFSILGPTTLPLTHDVAIVEQSTRRIVSFSTPNPDDKGLDGQFGSLYLAPWRDSKEYPSFLPPRLFEGPPKGSTFDFKRDIIKVFVLPQSVELFREGMGLYGVWVQVSETEESQAEVRKNNPKPKSRSKGKNKGKGIDDSEWWYCEFIYEIIPSFWAEDPPEPE